VERGLAHTGLAVFRCRVERSLRSWRGSGELRGARAYEGIGVSLEQLHESLFVLGVSRSGECGNGRSKEVARPRTRGVKEKLVQGAIGGVPDVAEPLFGRAKELHARLGGASVRQERG